MKSQAFWAVSAMAALFFCPPMLAVAMADGGSAVASAVPSLGGLESLGNLTLVGVLVWLLQGERKSSQEDAKEYQGLQGRLLEEAKAAAAQAHAAQERQTQLYLALVDKFLTNADKTVQRLFDGAPALLATVTTATHAPKGADL